MQTIIISQDWEKDFARKSIAWATDPKWTETDMSFLAENFKNVVIKDFLGMPYWLRIPEILFFIPLKWLILLYFQGTQFCTEKYFIKIYQKIFGDIKKINSSLHCKTKFKTKKMSRKQLHNEAMNWFSPKGCDTSCGACYAED